MRMDVYLAAVAADRATVEACFTALKARGLSCAASPLAGNMELAWDEMPAATIGRARLMVLFFSEAAKKSTPLSEEVTEALLRNLPVEVLCLDETVPSKRMAELLASATWDLIQHQPSAQEIENWAQAIHARLKGQEELAPLNSSLPVDDLFNSPESPDDTLILSKARPERPEWVNDLHNSLEKQLAKDPVERRFDRLRAMCDPKSRAEAHACHRGPHHLLNLDGRLRLLLRHFHLPWPDAGFSRRQHRRNQKPSAHGNRARGNDRATAFRQRRFACP